jgi:hypothetical protein
MPRGVDENPSGDYGFHPLAQAPGAMRSRLLSASFGAKELGIRGRAMSRRHEKSIAIAFFFLFYIVSDRAGVPFPWPIGAGLAGLALTIWVYRWLVR